eukprot:gene8508-biopygen1600
MFWKYSVGYVQRTTSNEQSIQVRGFSNGGPLEPGSTPGLTRIAPDVLCLVPFFRLSPRALCALAPLGRWRACATSLFGPVWASGLQRHPTSCTLCHAMFAAGWWGRRSASCPGAVSGCFAATRAANTRNPFAHQARIVFVESRRVRVFGCAHSTKAVDGEIRMAARCFCCCCRSIGSSGWRGSSLFTLQRPGRAGPGAGTKTHQGGISPPLPRPKKPLRLLVPPPLPWKVGIP